MDVIREWKRDHSRNVMALEAAVANLLSRNMALRQRGYLLVESDLLRGLVLQTPLAMFHRARGQRETA